MNECIYLMNSTHFVVSGENDCQYSENTEDDLRSHSRSKSWYVGMVLTLFSAYFLLTQVHLLLRLLHGMMAKDWASSSLRWRCTS